jgi:nitrogen-specific signal transduction histidine kinase
VLPHDYDRSLPQLPAYAGELNQVWTNLVDNAADAIDGMDGRGRLTVRTARDGDRALVEIGDNGAGISAGRPPISKALLHHQPVGKGTGLGLDICWRIVVQPHHGDLRFTSVPGDIRFQVLLPSSRTGEGAAPWAQAGSRRSPPWAAMAQITNTSRVMISSDQNG